MQEDNNRLTRLISSLCTLISNAYDTIVENDAESSEVDGDDIYNAFSNDAEKMIFSDKYNVAGTIDCLFKKENKEEYVMLDWKRSKS